MLTVGRVLDEPGLELAAIHLPDSGRVVTWVATSELADPTPYLQGHEILLTTGLGTERWTDEWHEYVGRLVAADVAALGLGTGLTHDEVPDALVAACRAHGLNLFAVPRPTAFVAVSRAVASLLDAEAEHAAQQALEAQRLLTRAALRGEDDAVLGQLGRLVGGTAAVLDAAGSEAALERRDGSTVVHPLGIAARPTAWLVVSTATPLLDAHRSAISAAVALLTLALERRRERRTQDRAVRARAVALLLAGDADTAALLLDAVGGALPSGQLRVLCVRAATEAVDDLLDLLDDAGLVAARVDGDLVAVGPARRAAQVSDLLVSSGATVGIGASVRAEEVGRSHDTAVHALAQTGPPAPVRTWDELETSGLATLLGAAATPYAEAYLAPLAGDRTHLETLAAYLTHHGSIGAAAAALGVHRNTVRNRVAAIEALLGRSLDDAATRAEAWVALSVAGLSGGPGGGS